MGGGRPMTAWEEAARQAKANRILIQLVALGVDHEECELLSDQAWEALAHLAGVNLPSWKTKDLVVQLLAEYDEARARMAAISSPLDGMEVVR